jgi:hypothetical protein
VFKFNDALYAEIFLMAVSAYRDEPIALEIMEFGVESVRIGKTILPTDEFDLVLHKRIGCVSKSRLGEQNRRF